MLFSGPNENKLESWLGPGGGGVRRGKGVLQSRVYRDLHFLNSSLSLTHSSTFFPFINVASFPGHFMGPCVFPLMP